MPFATNSIAHVEPRVQMETFRWTSRQSCTTCTSTSADKNDTDHRAYNNSLPHFVAIALRATMPARFTWCVVAGNGLATR